MIGLLIWGGKYQKKKIAVVGQSFKVMNTPNPMAEILRGMYRVAGRPRSVDGKWNQLGWRV